MINGDIVIPYSISFVINKFGEFDPDYYDIYLTATIIISIKFSGLDYMDEIMEYCSDNL